WARLGCPDTVDFDGAGTSAATPQVAAAAAIWLQKNRDTVDLFPEKWMRVEAIRKALFDGAKADPNQVLRLGRGELRAEKALAVEPSKPAAADKTAVDIIAFPLKQVLTGLGVQAETDTPQRRMLELEALQLSQNTDIEKILFADPSKEAPLVDWEQLRQALIAHPNASST